jgi:hypothetical protein
VLEGGRAVISTGEARPLRQRQVIQTPTGSVVRETTELVDAASGFEVVPRVAGDTSRLTGGALASPYGSSTTRGCSAASAVAVPVRARTIEHASVDDFMPLPSC